MQLVFNPIEGVFDMVSSGIAPGGNIEIITDDGTVISVLRVFELKGGDGVKVIADPDGSNKALITIDEIIPVYTQVSNPNGDHSPFTFVANTVDNYFISVNSSNGPITIKLPDYLSAIPPPNKSQFIVKDREGTSSTYPITITSENGMATVDQASSYTFVDDFESFECLYYNNNYEVF